MEVMSDSEVLAKVNDLVIRGRVEMIVGRDRYHRKGKILCLIGFSNDAYSTHLECECLEDLFDTVDNSTPDHWCDQLKELLLKFGVAGGETIDAAIVAAGRDYLQKIALDYQW